MRDTVLGISILIVGLFVIIFVAVVVGQAVDSMFTERGYGDYCTQIVDISDMEVVRCEYPDGVVCYHSPSTIDCLEK